MSASQNGSGLTKGSQSETSSSLTAASKNGSSPTKGSETSSSLIVTASQNDSSLLTGSKGTSSLRAASVKGSSLKRPSKRSWTPDPLDLVNEKTDEQFVAGYLQHSTKDPSPWVTAWTHPTTGVKYDICLKQPANLEEDELNACFRLIEETSRKDYENSAQKWHPKDKLKEMRSAELRYILVKEEETGEIHAFTSLMPTYEEGQPVIYCYEIHLKPHLQGTGLAALLISFLTTVAANLPPVIKVMLTCFLSNARGLAFYKKMGFEADGISPVPRILRFGKVFNPDYVILSKVIRSPSNGAGISDTDTSSMNGAGTSDTDASQ
ncbi:acyl-CoA N-acyltransferase [Podospora australis]|uniref:N-alpha-acetyltransferase 40 n=1 Tax=Podospora australis TaxID=1536484 RepID=A0AAN6WRS2_9PEZI|nr:acyl-CoA N-acyltransferase [Podospora australis]